MKELTVVGCSLLHETVLGWQCWCQSLKAGGALSMRVCTTRSWSSQYHSSTLFQTSFWTPSRRTVLPAYASCLSVPAHDAAHCSGRRTPVLLSLSGRWSEPLCGFWYTLSSSFPPHYCPHHGPGSWRQRNCFQRLPGSECSRGFCNKENKIFPEWCISIQSWLMCVCVCVCVCVHACVCVCACMRVRAYACVCEYCEASLLLDACSPSTVQNAYMSCSNGQTNMIPI